MPGMRRLGSRAATAGALCLALLALSSDASAAILNSGGEITIDSDRYADTMVIVRNAGCNNLVGSCASPGLPTLVNIVDGAVLGKLLIVRDSSHIHLTGGSVADLELRDSATMLWSGGRVIMNVYMQDPETLLTFVGHRFYIDGVMILLPYTGAPSHVSELVFLGNRITGNVLLLPDSSTEINNGLTAAHNVVDDCSDPLLNIRDQGCEGLGECASPVGPTEVQLADGSDVEVVQVWDHSSVSQTGGQTQAIYAFGEGHIAMSGGATAHVSLTGEGASFLMSGGEIAAPHSAADAITAMGRQEISIAGGLVGNSVHIGPDASLRVSGGEVQMGDGGYVSGYIELSGGSIVGGHLSEEVELVWSGGQISAGGEVGMLRIHARELTFNGSPFPEEGLTDVDLTTAGDLQGILASGEVLVEPPLYASVIQFVPVPEPGVAVLRASALLVVAALSGCRRGAPRSSTPIRRQGFGTVRG